MRGKKPSVSVDQDSYKNYLREAKNFEAAARSEKAAERLNASAVLYVHAAIAMCDAVTIYCGGKKSSGDNHLNAVALLSEIVMEDPRGKKEALQNLRLVLNRKSEVSYLGEELNKGEIEKMTKEYGVFTSWCFKILRR